MPKGESVEGPTWIQHIGEAEGAHDHRVDLLSFRAQLDSILEDVDNDLDSAFPTLADTEMRPKVLRAIEVVDALTTDAPLSPEERRALEQEIVDLELDMVRLMKAREKQGRDVRTDSIFNDAIGASEDHTVVIPKDWQSNVQ